MRAVIYNSAGAFALHSVRQALHGRRCEVVEARSEKDVAQLVRQTATGIIVLQAAARVAPVLAMARELRLTGNHAVAILLIAVDCRGEVILQAMRAGVNDVLGIACSEADV